MSHGPIAEPAANALRKARLLYENKRQKVIRKWDVPSL